MFHGSNDIHVARTAPGELTVVWRSLEAESDLDDVLRERWGEVVFDSAADLYRREFELVEGEYQALRLPEATWPLIQTLGDQGYLVHWNTPDEIAALPRLFDRAALEETLTEGQVLTCVNVVEKRTGLCVPPDDMRQMILEHGHMGHMGLAGRLVRFYEKAAGNGLDTDEREVLLETLAVALTGKPWPSNSDDRKESVEFFADFLAEAKQRGWGPAPEAPKP